MKTKKLVAIFLTAVMAASAMNVTAFAGQASDSTESLKIVMKPGDLTANGSRIDTPWLNRSMGNNLMFRALFIATNSDLTEVKGDLAEDYNVSEDGLTYTITLKDGLSWSDGEALTVDDVQWSIETALKAAKINSIYTAAFANIDSMETDGNTITIKMKTPYATMLDVLAQFAILPKHCLENTDPLNMEADDYWKKPVTSGMFVLDELNTGNYYTLKYNDKYEGTEPKIKNVTCYYINDYLTAAQDGKADFIVDTDPALEEALNGMDNFTAYSIDSLFYKYLIFNMKGTDGKENEAMQNVEVRKALIEAIDRATLATLYPNASVLNSGVPNDNDAYNGFEYTFDADKAKADLEASGYDMGRTLKICYYNNDQTSVDLINTIVYYIEQTGLKVEATLSSDGTTDLFTTRDYDIGFKGKGAFSINEWYTEYMSTDGLFSNIFGGDTDFDEPIAKLTTATSAEETKTALENLETLEQEKVYKIPLFTVGTYAFVSDKVTLPEGVEFCNPLYMNDIDFTDWEMNE